MRTVVPSTKTSKLFWVLVTAEGLWGWLLSEAARSFPSSNSDLPLAKAEPISNGGSTSVIAYLRRGKTAEK